MKHKLVIAMTAATLFLVGCGQRQHTEQVTLVRIDTVKTANTCDILEFPARVQAAGEVHLAFKIPGTLQRIYVDDGVRVNLLPKWIRAITNFSYRRSKPNI